MKGVFIAIEGLDGAGKGFVMMRLQEFIMGKSKKYDHLLLTREPTYGPVGREIRALLAKEKDAFKDGRKFAELYSKDRAWHVKEHIQPALDKGYVVLCDRYKYSTIAFQQTQGLSFKEVFDLNKDFPAPDLTILLDLPAKEALQRISARDGKNEKFEDEKFMEKLRGKYLQLPMLLPDDNLVVIDASKDKETVFSQVKEKLEESGVLPY